jgi:hypothetical protein
VTLAIRQPATVATGASAIRERTSSKLSASYSSSAIQLDHHTGLVNYNDIGAANDQLPSMVTREA